MHTTVAQNQAHRNDTAWQGSKISQGEYIREYVNVFTGQTIRKSCAMTGQDWHLFDANGALVARAHSLTFAKYLATQI